MLSWKLLILLAYLTVISSSLVRDYSDKRGTANFSPMVRYGRANGLPFITKNLKPQVLARATAFEYGPRYGKRSVWNPNSSVPYPESTSHPHDGNLQCTWVGLSNLYRCSQKKNHLLE